MRAWRVDRNTDCTGTPQYRWVQGPAAGEGRHLTAAQFHQTISGTEHFLLRSSASLYFIREDCALISPAGLWHRFIFAWLIVAQQDRQLCFYALTTCQTGEMAHEYQCRSDEWNSPFSSGLVSRVLPNRSGLIHQEELESCLLFGCE